MHTQLNRSHDRLPYSQHYPATPRLWAWLYRIPALGASLASLLGLFAESWWRLELATHFRVQYFIALSAATLIFFLVRERRVALVVGAIALFNGATLLPAWLPAPSPPETARTYRAVAINIEHPNPPRHRRSATLEPGPDRIPRGQPPLGS